MGAARINHCRVGHAAGLQRNCGRVMSGCPCASKPIINPDPRRVCGPEHPLEILMSIQSFICVVATLALLAPGAPALAQRDDRRDPRPREGRGEMHQIQRDRESVRDSRRDSRKESRRDARRYSGRENVRGRYDPWDARGRGYDRARDEWRGAGPYRNFYRGGRLPPQFHHRHYVVDDWRGHRLSAPPRGHHWVQTGSDYLLVAIATGVIVQMLLDY